MGDGQSMDGLEGSLLEAGTVSFPVLFLILPPFPILTTFSLVSRNMECERQGLYSAHHLMKRLYNEPKQRHQTGITEASWWSDGEAGLRQRTVPEGCGGGLEFLPRNLGLYTEL